MSHLALVKEHDHFINYDYGEGRIVNYFTKTGNTYRTLNGRFDDFEGLPAIEYASGKMCHYMEGKLHSTKGAAIINVEGDDHYYLKGVNVTHAEWKRAMKWKGMTEKAKGLWRRMT